MAINDVNLVLKAISYASQKHKDQYRKDEKTPYISHPFRVMTILSAVFGVTDEKILAAAVLHDTIEDTTTDFDDLHEEFGIEIAQWVAILTKDKRMIEEEREREYRATLLEAPYQAKLIKIADFLDNVIDSSTLEDTSHREKAIKKAKEYSRAFSEQKIAELSSAITILNNVMTDK